MSDIPVTLQPEGLSNEELLSVSNHKFFDEGLLPGTYQRELLRRYEKALDKLAQRQYGPTTLLR